MITGSPNEHGQLLLRFREKGDVDAFDRLIVAYQKPLYNYLLKLLQNKEDAEDGLQEIWIKVIRQCGSYQEKGRFSSWIFCIAHNYCLDLFRRRRHRINDEEFVETRNGLALLDIIPANVFTPSEAAMEKEMMALLEHEIKDMPVLIREVYLLRAQHGIPFKEIAEIQKSPLGTVLSRMHQAVKWLEPIIRLYMKESDPKTEESA
ncbi:MAG: sigma-70 family RNA polymerase sigma factor [Candidatus Omnitrophota bacterium]